MSPAREEIERLCAKHAVPAIGDERTYTIMGWTTPSGCAGDVAFMRSRKPDRWVRFTCSGASSVAAVERVLLAALKSAVGEP